MRSTSENEMKIRKFLSNENIAHCCEMSVHDFNAIIRPTGSDTEWVKSRHLYLLEEVLLHSKQDEKEI